MGAATEFQPAAMLSGELMSILGLTRDVLQRVEQGEWQQAAVLDGERQQKLRELCARLEPSTTSREVLSTLSEVLRLNDALIGAVEHRQRTLLREADTVKLGQRAVAAYGNHSGAAPR